MDIFIPALLFLFIILLLAATLLIIASAAATALFNAIKDVPYVPTKPDSLHIMMEMAGVKSGECIMDLGSGDGALVIEAARRGARAVGVEYNPFLVWYSRGRIRWADLDGKAKIIRGDFWQTPLSDADILLLYLTPPTLSRLKEKFSRELTTGTRIVTNTYPIPGWTPVKEREGVFLYQIS
jgi:predicted methyltransferase